MARQHPVSEAPDRAPGGHRLKDGPRSPVLGEADRAFTCEVAALEPASRLVMRTAESPTPMETVYTWEPVGEAATRMTLRNPEGSFRLAAPW
jgi:hypothetical protein